MQKSTVLIIYAPPFSLVKSCFIPHCLLSDALLLSRESRHDERCQLGQEKMVPSFPDHPVFPHCIIRVQGSRHSINTYRGTSLVVWWFRFCFAVQGMRVWARVQELGSHNPQST